MGEAQLVADETAEGQHLIDDLALDGFDIRIACWLYPFDGPRKFAIVSKEVDAQGKAKAYQRVFASLQKVSEGLIAFEQIVVVGPGTDLGEVLREVVVEIEEKVILPCYMRSSKLRRFGFGGIYAYNAPNFPMTQRRLVIQRIQEWANYFVDGKVSGKVDQITLNQLGRAAAEAARPYLQQLKPPNTELDFTLGETTSTCSAFLLSSGVFLIAHPRRYDFDSDDDWPNHELQYAEADHHPLPTPMTPAEMAAGPSAMKAYGTPPA